MDIINKSEIKSDDINELLMSISNDQEKTRFLIDTINDCINLCKVNEVNGEVGVNGEVKNNVNVNGEVEVETNVNVNSDNEVKNNVNSENEVNDEVDKISILSNYVSKLHSVPQRSDEWYDLRKTTIGGSEISALLGLNSYENMNSLISKKLGINSFNGNIHTRWGTIFEPITNEWAMYAFNVKCMTELGSVEGVIPRQRYSPDGVGIVKLLDNQDNIVLFEYKSPSCTIPNGKIAKNYKCQVQTGLLSINIAEYAIFINNCYRKCKLADLSNDIKYDYVYHKSDNSKPKIHMNKMQMFMCGVMCFYIDHKTYLNVNIDYSDVNNYIAGYSENENLSDKEQLLLYECSKIPVDFGEHTSLEHLLKLWDDKVVKVKYSPIIWNNKVINSLDIIKKNKLEKPVEDKLNIDARMTEYIIELKDEIAEEGVFIGLLPWKLLLTDNIIEKKDPKWYDFIKTPLETYFNKLDSLNSSEAPHDEFLKEIMDVDTEIDLSGFLE